MQKFCGICVLIAVTWSCDVVSPAKESLFTKLSAERTGISFINENREDDAHNVLTYEYFYNGGGVAIGDINNDGLVDVYFTSNQGSNKLYLNKGNFLFEDITNKAGVSCKDGWKTGVAMVDINHDGFLDIYVCKSAGSHPLLRENVLYINNRNLTFSDQAYAYGLNDGSYSTQAAFFDYDKDDDLDIFLLNHSLLDISNAYDVKRNNITKREPFVGNKFYKNENGKFVDVSDSVGVFGPASNYGLGIAVSDINNDGWLDVYASNDYTGKDKFLLNRTGQYFVDVTDSLLSHISQFSMGVDIADINNDGLYDVMTLDMLPSSNQRQKELFWPDRYDVYNAMVTNGLHHQFMRNMLHLNMGNGTFSEIGQIAGVSNTDWSWSVLFGDYDNDGLQDVFITNGYKRDYTNNDFLKYKADVALKAGEGKPIEKMMTLLNKIPSNKPANQIFKNNDGLSFSDQSNNWGFAEPVLTNGAAYGDLDNDGDLDLVLNNLDGVAGVYRNDAELSGNNYVKLRLQGKGKNTFALGAKATMYIGNQMMVRTLSPSRGFQSSVEPALFFGVGKEAAIDSLVIGWPNGEQEIFFDVKTNQTLTLIQGQGKSHSQLKAIKRETTLLVPQIQELPYRHVENQFVDFKTQRLLPRKYSTQGPALAIADVNGDGLEDIFIGGSKNAKGALMLQQPHGGYTVKSFEDLLAGFEDVDALFFDMDNDEDMDLYLVSGGYEYDNDDKFLRDRLFRNDGKGNFSAVSLPDVSSSGSCARASDIDADGDLDLFVGGRLVPGRYPEKPLSYILMNDGHGNFSPAENSIAKTLADLGMVTDASWIDLNNDRQKDLVVVGEWMPITILINEKGKLINRTAHYLPEKTEGWWNVITTADFDSDGDEDFVVGNFGLNNQWKPSEARPVNLFYGDFDKNGSVDPIMNYFIGDNSYPSPTRDELMDQLPQFKKRFPDYKSFSGATINTILNESEKINATVLIAHTFETSFFRNNGGSLQVTPLPFAAQFAPVFGLCTMDINNDGNLDLITGGNLSSMSARFGKATGNYGSVFMGDGKGNFKYISPAKTGLSIRGDIRSIKTSSGKVVVTRNNDTPLIISFR